MKDDFATTSVIEQFAINTNIPSIDASRANVTRYGTAADELWTVTGNIVARNSYSALLDMAGGNDTLGVLGNVGASGSGKITLNAEYVGINGSLTAATKGVNTINSDNIAIHGVVNASGASSVNQLYTQNPGGQIALGMGLSASGGGLNDIAAKYTPSGLSGRSGLQLILDGNMTADGGENRITGTDDNDRFVINGDMEAYGSKNTISVGKGSDSLTIHGQLISDGSGSVNFISRNAISGTNELNLEYGMYAANSGRNDVVWRGQSTVSVDSMEAVLSGINTLSVGGYKTVFDINNGMLASDYGSNTITLNTYNGYPVPSGTLEVFGGMEATKYGSNTINGYVYSDTVSLHGDFSYSGGGTASPTTSYGNKVSLGAENDHLYIDGTVGANGLFVSGGTGYDELTLSAATTADMASRYQTWLQGAGNLSNANLKNWFGDFESIQVELSGGYRNLNTLTWLDTVVDRFETKSGNQIDLELNVDHFGRSLTLSSFFTGRNDDIFDAVNMRGDTANTLRISGDLSANAIDASEFKIHGDANDTVKISMDWVRGDNIVSSDGSPAYVEYNNTNGVDTLLLQAEIQVLLGV